MIRPELTDEHLFVVVVSQKLDSRRILTFDPLSKEGNERNVTQQLLSI